MISRTIFSGSSALSNSALMFELTMSVMRENTLMVKTSDVFKLTLTLPIGDHDSCQLSPIPSSV